MHELRRTRAKVFLAQGAADRAVSRESFEMLVADLAGAGRQPRAILVPDADHSFLVSLPGRERHDKWPEVLSQLLDWFLSHSARMG